MSMSTLHFFNSNVPHAGPVPSPTKLSNDRLLRNYFQQQCGSSLQYSIADQCMTSSFDFSNPSTRIQRSTPGSQLPATYSTANLMMDSPTTTSAGIFSPEANFFDDDFVAPAYIDQSANVSTNPFFQGNNNNPYRRHTQAQRISGIYDHLQQPTWPPMHEEDSRTPASNNSSQKLTDLTVGSTDSQVFSGLPINVLPASVFQPTLSGNPPSPHSNKEWMAIAAQEMESRSVNKRIYLNTPPACSSSPFPCRDGIRKKSARFEIPPERSLLNIDQLIAQSTNEEEVKELKQQKRLLRNRQAALDSRQRKKKHTEELEEEKKLWIERVIQLEDDLQRMRLQVEAAMHEKEQWHRQQLEVQQLIEQKDAAESALQLLETQRFIELEEESGQQLETQQFIEEEDTVEQTCRQLETPQPIQEDVVRSAWHQSKTRELVEKKDAVRSAGQRKHQCQVREVPGFLERRRISAFPDSGSSFNIISEDLVSQLGSNINTFGSQLLQLPLGIVKSLGTVDLSFRFKDEDTYYPLTFHVMNKCIHDCVLGSKFLKDTQTLTKNLARRVKKRLVDTVSFLRLCLLESSEERLLGSVNGQIIGALADTGAYVNVISRSTAKQLDLKIMEGNEYRTKLKLMNGTVAPTSGMVLNVEWRFGVAEEGPSHRLDFHVLDDLPCGLILCEDFLFENDVFSVYEDFFYDTAFGSHPLADNAFIGFIAEIPPQSQARKAQRNATIFRKICEALQNTQQNTAEGVVELSQAEADGSYGDSGISSDANDPGQTLSSDAAQSVPRRKRLRIFLSLSKIRRIQSLRNSLPSLQLPT